jgi:hypothetical protein
MSPLDFFCRCAPMIFNRLQVIGVLALTTTLISCSNSPAASSKPSATAPATPTAADRAAPMAAKSLAPDRAADAANPSPSGNLLSPSQLAELAQLPWPALAPTELPDGFKVVKFNVGRGQYANGDDDSGYSIRYEGPDRTCLNVYNASDGPRGQAGIRTVETSFGPVKVFRETHAKFTSLYSFVPDQRSIYVGTTQDQDCKALSDAQFDRVVESMGQVQTQLPASPKPRADRVVEDRPEDRTRRLEVARQLDADQLCGACRPGPGPTAAAISATKAAMSMANASRSRAAR